MCQAFGDEHQSVRQGFKAAHEGKPNTDNPYSDGDKRKAWDHGWDCYYDGILPFAIEVEIRKTKDNVSDRIVYASEVANEFFTTRQITPEIQRVLDRT